MQSELTTQPTTTRAAKRQEQSRGADIDYDAFVNYFNATIALHKSIIPRIMLMNDRRRQALDHLAHKYGKNAIAAYIRRAAISRFLNGYNSYRFSANIEWLLRERNFLRVMEGLYDDPPANRALTPHEALLEQQRQRRLQARDIEEAEHQAADQRRNQARARAATVDEIRSILGDKCTI